MNQYDLLNNYLIEQSIIKDENKLKEFSDKLKINVEETKIFLKYYTIFNFLNNIENNSIFLNIRKNIDFFTFQKKDNLTDEILFNVIATFLNNLNIKNTNKIKFSFHLKFFKDFIKYLKNPEKYYFEFDFNLIDSFILDNLYLFNYDSNLFDYYNEITLKAIKKIIENLIEINSFKLIDVNIINIDKVIRYSEKFPNKFKEIRCYANNINEEKIRKLIESNSESLKITIDGKLNLYKNCKNLNIINSGYHEIPFPFPETLNYSNIKEIYWNSFENEDFNNQTQKIIEFYNKFPNLEIIYAGEICADFFFEIFSKIKCPKLKKLNAVVEDISYEENDNYYEKVVSNFPLLEILEIEEHQTMNWSYAIKPIWIAESKRIPFPLLEIIINNYLKNPNNFIDLEFDIEFEGFYDYFKDKINIMNRINHFKGNNYLNYELPFLKSISITNKDEFIKFNVKHVDEVIIYVDVNEKIKEFLFKVNPKLIIFKKEIKNFEEFCNIEKIEFILIENKKIYVKKKNIFYDF